MGQYVNKRGKSTIFSTFVSFICEDIFNDQIYGQNEIPRARHVPKNVLQNNLGEIIS